MPNSTKEIKRRIKSIGNIGQITKAMELVSAAKMRKAQILAIASRPYAVLSSELLQNLAGKTDASTNPLINRVLPLGKTASQKVLIILISSDRGLAGAFNSNVINKALEIVKAEGAEKIDFVTIGKKGTDAILRMKYNIAATFPSKDKLTARDAEPIAVMAMDEFLAYKYEKVFVVYTDFVSTLVQKPNMLQVLPFVSQNQEEASKNQETEFLFEPDADEILEGLIQRTIKFAVYQSMVEAAASEHSARMVAMRNANEAAGDLLDELSLSYNQARQAAITRELSEISAAKLAMEN